MPKKKRMTASEASIAVDCVYTLMAYGLITGERATKLVKKIRTRPKYVVRTRRL